MSPADLDAAVPVAALAAFLDESFGAGGGEVEVRKIGQGRSNLTFLVRRGPARWVLRRPPLGDLPATAHDVLREHRVLSALAATPVRAPRPVVACEDTGVLGVPFYLMEVVDGAVVRERLPDAYASRDAGAVGDELVDALAELHAVDPASVGLGDPRRGEGYTRRQIERWAAQWQVMATRELPDVEVVRAWLSAHAPEASGVSVVHGDYKLDNVVFSEAPPVRLRAILDWEMATLGDPLADLGYLLLFWPEPGEDALADLVRVSREPGHRTRAELVARYEQRTGTAVRDLGFYRTLALWKLTILLEGLYKRYRAGKAGSEWYAQLESAVPALARTARGWCEA